MSGDRINYLLVPMILLLCQGCYKKSGGEDPAGTELTETTEPNPSDLNRESVSPAESGTDTDTVDTTSSGESDTPFLFHTGGDLESGTSTDVTDPAPDSSDTAPEPTSTALAPPSSDPFDSESLETSDTHLHSDTNVDSESQTFTDPAPCCLSKTIHWGVDCGMGHIDPTFVLGGCEETPDLSTAYLCDPSLAECDHPDLIDPRDINPLLEQADLLGAFEIRGTLYGTSAYPIFYIGLGAIWGEESTRVFVGDPCREDDSDCVPIPPSLQELRALLDTIVLEPDNYPIGSAEERYIDCMYHI